MPPTTLHLEFWQAILLCSMLIGGFFACVSVSFRIYDRANEKRFTDIEQSIVDIKADAKTLSADVLRREDWLRHVTSNERALDKVQVSLAELTKSVINISHK